MTFLLLNQAFHPDHAATAQYLTQFAIHLTERGHNVTVITSRRAYDHPRLYPKREAWCGITIYRIWATGFGKTTRWRRALDFATFYATCAFRLFSLPRYDAIVALTSPPLISFLAALVAKLRRAGFYYWVMDLNPDQAIAAGWLASNSLVTRILESMSRFSLRHASRIIVLDRFMQERILAKGPPAVSADKVAVIPLWPDEQHVTFDRAGRDQFRKQHGLEGKFVVMYSGNHSPCHPLDTLLRAAQLLRHQDHIHFCFVGGGTEWSKLRACIQNPKSVYGNLVCLPYQRGSELAASLSAADLHVVVMGDPFIGIVHPCKLYNILNVAAPILYIGREPSHVSDLLATLGADYSAASFRHGDPHGVAKFISTLAARPPQTRKRSPALRQVSQPLLLSRLLAAIEQLPGTLTGLDPGETRPCNNPVQTSFANPDL